jgi:2-hydroxychromene-2-carboxylate isomerase
MTRYEFIYDVASPNAYLAWKTLPALEQRCGVSFTAIPVLLGGILKATGNQPPMVAFAGCPPKMDYMRREMMRYINRHGLTRFQMNPHFPVNTLLAMRGAVAADNMGVGPAYRAATMQAMWEDGKDLSDPETLHTVLTEAGLDAQAILEGAQDTVMKDTLKQNTEDAIARGVFSAPSFFVGDELFFGKDHMRDMEDEIAAQKG